MVLARGHTQLFHAVSVLALSSRFDGRNGNLNTAIILTCFSTRSVESF